MPHECTEGNQWECKVVAIPFYIYRLVCHARTGVSMYDCWVCPIHTRTMSVTTAVRKHRLRDVCQTSPASAFALSPTYMTLYSRGPWAQSQVWKFGRGEL